MPDWKINNGDFYVAKSGSTDPQTAGDANQPFRTIQQALDAAANLTKTPVVIVIGAGYYQESLSFSAEGRIHLSGDGKVLLSPATAGGVLLNQRGGAFRLDLSHLTVENTGALLAGNQVQLGVYDCTLNQVRIDYSLRESTFTHCTFQDSRIWAVPQSSGYATYAKCSFLHAEVGGLGQSNQGACSVMDCHFDHDSRITDADSRRIGQMDHNNFQFSSGQSQPGFEFELDGVTHILLDSLQRAFPDWNQRSMDVDPQFNRATFEDFTLHPSSPMAYAASDGLHIGAAEIAESFGAGTSSVLDTRNLLLTGVEYNSGSFRLRSGFAEGTIETQPIDLKAPQTLGKIRMFATQSYPANVVDSSNRSDSPNRQTFEMRFGNDPQTLSNYLVFEWDEIPTFNPSGVLTRSPVGNGEPAFDPGRAEPVVAQFVQLKVTLRNNGIQA